MPIADKVELEGFLKAYPDVQMLEAMIPDMNGILRCKRIHRREFGALFGGGIKIPGTGLDQLGTQYCVAEDLWQFDEFLNDVREACELQNGPVV